MILNGSHAENTKRPETKSGGNQPVQGALLDAVAVKVETYLGETSMSVAKLNELKAGGIVTLDATLDEAVELRVNGVLVARGELVAVGDKFGVRITAVA